MIKKLINIKNKIQNNRNILILFFLININNKIYAQINISFINGDTFFYNNYDVCKKVFTKNIKKYTFNLFKNYYYVDSVINTKIGECIKIEYFINNYKKTVGIVYEFRNVSVDSLENYIFSKLKVKSYYYIDNKILNQNFWYLPLNYWITDLGNNNYKVIIRFRNVRFRINNS